MSTLFKSFTKVIQSILEGENDTNDECKGEEWPMAIFAQFMKQLQR